MEKTTKAIEAPGVSRRRFLGYAGALAGAGMITLQSCGKDDDPVVTDNRVNLGSGDTGILNYAYALEQLEAAFYKQVIERTAGTSIFSAAETSRLTDIKDHEQAHRDFFKAALSNNAIKDLTPDFSRVDFGNRTSILETARTFEDLGVAAYNGAGKLIQNADYLLLAGKIVSVEARHAAYIRDLISNGSFADLGSLSAFGAVDAKGLDGALSPSQVLTLADPYITDAINADNLPK